MASAISHEMTSYPLYLRRGNHSSYESESTAYDIEDTIPLRLMIMLRLNNCTISTKCDLEPRVSAGRGRSKPEDGPRAIDVTVSVYVF